MSVLCILLQLSNLYTSIYSFDSESKAPWKRCQNSDFLSFNSFFHLAHPPGKYIHMFLSQH